MSRKYPQQPQKQKHRSHAATVLHGGTADSHSRAMLFGTSAQHNVHGTSTFGMAQGLVTELEWNLLEKNTLAELVERLTHGPVAATAGAGGGIGGMPAENSSVWRAVAAGLKARADAIGEHKGSFFTNKCCYDKYAALRKQHPGKSECNGLLMIG